MSLALTILAANLVNARLARFRLEADVTLWISEGEHAIREDHPEVAAKQFATAAQLAASDPGLRGLRDRASRLSDHARRIKEVRDKADELFRRDEPLRFRLFGDSGDPKIAREIKAALRLFDVPDNPGWSRQPDLALLDEGRRKRLLDEVNQMLFLWFVALDGVRPDGPRSGASGAGDLRLGRRLHRAERALAAPPRAISLRCSTASPRRGWSTCRARDFGAGLLPVGDAPTHGEPGRRGDRLAGARRPAQAGRLLVAVLPGLPPLPGPARPGGARPLQSGGRPPPRGPLGAVQSRAAPP